MKKIVIAASLLLLSTTAFATQPGNQGGGNGGCGVGQTTNGCGTTNNGGSAVQSQGQIQGQAQGQLQTLRNQVYNGGSQSSATAGGGGGGAATSSATQSQGTNISNVGNQYNQYPASSATAPSFSIGQCQWAISVGGQALLFGASFGTAGMYEFCKPIMKAKHFYEIGKPHVAKNLECNYSEFREAYRMAGEPCRNDMSKAEIAAADAQATQYLNSPGKAPICYSASGAIVPVGQRGAVRCE